MNIEAPKLVGENGLSREGRNRDSEWSEILLV